MTELTYCIEIDLSQIQLPKEIACSPDIKAINLEDEAPFMGADFRGPFFGITRDYQDATNTCYAITARNLLIGASQGLVNPSYLDLALQYKKTNSTSGTLEEEGLDWGTSCEVISAANELGYCDQQYSPLEMGKENVIIHQLGISNETAKAEIFKLFKNFKTNLNVLQKNNPSLYSSLSSNLLEIVLNLAPISSKADVAKFIFKEEIDWEILSNLNDSSAFEEVYNAQINKLNILVTQSIIEGKDEKDIQALFDKNLNPLMLKLPQYEVERIKNKFKRDLNVYFDERLKSLFTNYLSILNPSSDNLKLGHLSYQCAEQFYLNDFEKINSLRRLALYLKANPATMNAISNLKSSSLSDVLQVVIAPECLNPKQREKTKEQVSCQNLPKISLQLMKLPNVNTILFFSRHR